MPNVEDILIILEDLSQRIDELEQGTGNIVVNASQVLLQSLADFGTNESGVPTGQVFLGMFMGNCPSGWSRQSQFDGRTVYGATTYGATGGTSATTSESHTHGSGSYFASGDGAHSHSYHSNSTNYTLGGGAGATGTLGSSNTTGGASDHTHGIGGTSGSSGSGGGNWPPYRAVVFCSP